jgi:hypothetical protein
MANRRRANYPRGCAFSSNQFLRSTERLNATQQKHRLCAEMAGSVAFSFAFGSFMM